MQVLSPRSYVTGAFDLLFLVLLERVYDRLKTVPDWWVKYVIDYTDKLFSDPKLRELVENSYKPDCWEDLFEYFDEYSLLKLVTDKKINARKHFKSEIEIFDGLMIIRNDWAHRGRYDNKWGDDGALERDWALIACNDLYDAAEFLNRDDIANQIFTLIMKMEHDWISRDVKLRPYNELIAYLDEHVMKKVCESDLPIDNEIRQRVLRARNDLFTHAKNSEYVIDFFWNAVKNKTDIYFELKEHELTTFEDICARFAVFSQDDSN